MSPSPLNILILDDEESIRFAFQRFLEMRGHRVVTAATIAEARTTALEEAPDLAFFDLRLPDGDGIDLFAELSPQLPDTRFVIMTAYGTLDTVQRALQGGAFEYLVKPLDLDEAETLVRQVAEHRRQDDKQNLGGTESDFIGHCPAMQEVFKRIGLAARVDSTILILGETGTGKELAARAIHDLGPRQQGPFVPINCGALPENLVESELFGHARGSFTGADTDKQGRFEAARKGTLFLDEIGELPPAAQVKLLRVLDAHVIERVGSTTPIPVDVRIVAATNRDLAAEVKAGRFRADLFYRLAVIRLPLPPLRNREDDTIHLAKHFLSQYQATLGDEAANCLLQYKWPGNVRELRNAMEHAALISAGGLILPVHLPESVTTPRPAAPSSADVGMPQLLSDLEARLGDSELPLLEALEEELIRFVLADCDNNQMQAAKRLGIHRNTLHRKLNPPKSTGK